MIDVDVPGWVLLAAAFAFGIGLWGGIAQHGHTSIIDGGTLSPSATVPMVPTGTLLPFGGNAAPAGFLTCDGSAVDRVTYAALYAVLGTAYGAGDGVTTFNVPDLRGRSPLGDGAGPGLTNRVLGATGGEESHVLLTAELASHAHTLTDGGHSHTGGLHTHTMGNHTHTATAHSHDLSNHTHTGGAHTHDLGNHTHTGPSHTHGFTGVAWYSGASGTFLNPTGGSGDTPLVTDAAGTGATGTPSTNTSGSDGAVATGIPSVNATSSMSSGATSGPSTNTSDSGGNVATSSSATGMTMATTGSGTAHNTMHPFTVCNFIIKT